MATRDGNKGDTWRIASQPRGNVRLTRFTPTTPMIHEVWFLKHPVCHNPMLSHAFVLGRYGIWSLLWAQLGELAVSPSRACQVGDVLGPPFLRRHGWCLVAITRGFGNAPGSP